MSNQLCSEKDSVLLSRNTSRLFWSLARRTSTTSKEDSFIATAVSFVAFIVPNREKVPVDSNVL